MPLGGIQSQPDSACFPIPWEQRLKMLLPKRQHGHWKSWLLAFAIPFPAPGTNTYFKRIAEGQSLKKTPKQTTPKQKGKAGSSGTNSILEEQGEEAASPSGSALLLSKLFVAGDCFSVPVFSFSLFFCFNSKLSLSLLIVCLQILP